MRRKKRRIKESEATTTRSEHGRSRRVKASLSIDETEETSERVKKRENVVCVTLEERECNV